MAKNFYNIALALAGVNQSATLVQQLAHEGQCNSEALRTTLTSILRTNPESTLAVYGNNEQNIQLGLNVMLNIFGNSEGLSVQNEVVRYTMGLIILGRKLQANPEALQALSSRISQLDRQLNHFDVTSDTIIGALADIYVDVISPLGAKIQVTGTPDYLMQNSIQTKVRATLLGGIRSAILWQQVGGRRIQFLFSRTRICEQAKSILTRA